MYSGGDTVLTPILNVPTSVDTKTTSVASTTAGGGTTTTVTGTATATSLGAADTLNFDPHVTTDPNYTTKLGIIAVAAVVAGNPSQSGASMQLTGDTTDTFTGMPSGFSQGTGGVSIRPEAFTAADGLTGPRLPGFGERGAGGSLDLLAAGRGLPVVWQPRRGLGEEGHLGRAAIQPRQLGRLGPTS